MAQNANCYIAVDLGAESGRVMLGRVAEGRLGLEQVHRFANGPVEEQGSLRWDFDRLLSDIKTGIGLAVKKAGGPVQG
ncbi:MAG: rhamnulokinase, partial [Phycisphaerales bacterium]